MKTVVKQQFGVSVYGDLVAVLSVNGNTCTTVKAPMNTVTGLLPVNYETSECPTSFFAEILDDLETASMLAGAKSDSFYDTLESMLGAY